MVCGEATTTKIFDLTIPGLEPTIYHTLHEHANHYIIDAVQIPQKHVSNIF
jgi:hypothetical protein